MRFKKNISQLNFPPQYRLHSTHRIIHRRDPPIRNSRKRLHHLQLLRLALTHLQSIRQPSRTGETRLEVLRTNTFHFPQGGTFTHLDLFFLDRLLLLDRVRVRLLLPLRN